MADEIFREINDELRQERWTRLWQKYNRHILAAAILIVLGTAGAVAWRDHRRHEAETMGALFTSILVDSAGDPAHAAADLDRLAANGGTGYPLLARFEAAILKAKGGDKAAAVTEFSEIAADDRVDSAYRDLALLLAADYGIDTDASPELLKRLAPITVAPNAWRFSALELQALGDWKAGDHDAALKIYQQLADDLDAPGSLRARAAEIVDAFRHQG